MQAPFRTVLNKVSFDSIDHSSRILMMGSCFSEHIGEKLINRKFNVVLNPFGILYHPFSIFEALKRMIENKPFTVDDLKLENGRYISFFHHGKFNHRDPQIMRNNINEAFEQGRAQLLNADFLFITWGTAFGYIHIKNEDQIVANCHKIPGKYFTKKLVDPEEIIAAYEYLFDKIRLINPNIKIVITISPVKHLKDGLINNNLSKSVLLLAAHRLKSNDISYFPAYELITDDLRDYRFYAKDMAHPSQEGVEYVWDYFKAGFWNKTTIDLNRRIEVVLNAVNHRPLHPENKSHRNFVKSVVKKITGLENEYSFLDLSKEKKSLL
jgi:hypothetical protein